MMEKWKLALKKFLEEYENDDDITGAILCGSYASGNNNKHSDIDVYMISRNDFKQERGNKEVNGFLIEYFINPVWKVKEYLEKNYENGILTMSNMLCYGKVIFDTDGSLNDLIHLASEYIDKPLEGIKEKDLLNAKYHIWDNLDELKVLKEEESPGFNMTYYLLLNSVMETYFKYMKVPLLPDSKVYKILTDSKFKERYHIFKLPDDKFIKMYLKCLEDNLMEERYQDIEKLVNYFYDRTGGFDIDGFVLSRDLGGNI